MRAPSRSMKRSRRLRAGVLALTCLAATACGARWTEEQTQEVLALEQASSGNGTTRTTLAGGDGVPSTAAPGDGAGDVDGVTTTTAAGTATTTPGAGGGDNSGGGAPATTAPPAGGGGPVGGGAGGALACAAPSDEVGVADGQLTVGNPVTLTGPVPGLGESAAAATRAYVAYKNATGGVCGRAIELVSADDGQDNSRFRSIVADLEPRSFALLGGIMGGDAGGVQIVNSTGIPVVSVPVSLDFHAVSTVFGLNPPFENLNEPYGKHEFLVSQGITKAALVYPGLDQTRAEVNAKHRPQMEAAGMEIVLTQELPLSTLNYDAAARAVANSGAQYMLFVGAGGQNASMARSIAGTGYDLAHPDYLTGYSPDFVELAGDAAEGSAAWIRVLPSEEAGGNAEQSLFLEWMGRTAPGTAADVFAADAWVAAKAFFETLESLDGPITRDGFIAALRQLNDFDAGGFMGAVQVGNNFTNGCQIGMQVQGGQWRRIAPGTGFLC